MANGFSRSPKLLKGALIQFSAPMLIPVPNLIVFQYNPETLSRSLSPWAPPEKDDTGKVDDKTLNKLAQPYDPQESFTLNLELDATDALESPTTHPVEFVVGVADRLAAIEMLLYPPGGSAISGALNVAANLTLGGGNTLSSLPPDVITRTEVPIVLFFWGPGRIVPVRLSSMTIDELQFSPILYPIKAKASLGMKVLDTSAFDSTGSATELRDQTAIVKIAKACYTFTLAQKKALALANIANSIESIAGMLPF